jgi:putative alpha-1,2-mannosidase
MPVLGTVTNSPGSNWLSYSSTFRHENEQAGPGYYSVIFDNGLRTELTATTRTGIGRFTFANVPRGSLLINLGGSANGNRDEGTTAAIVSPREVAGSIVSGDCGGWFTYKIYFALKFDRPMLDFGSWSGDAINWDAVANGADIDFKLTDTPNAVWGTDRTAAAPSFDLDVTFPE